MTGRRAWVHRFLAVVVLLLIGPLVTMVPAAAVGGGESVRSTSSSTSSTSEDTATSAVAGSCSECPPSPEVTLTQRSTTSEVGTRLSLTAKVVGDESGYWLIYIDDGNANPQLLADQKPDTTLEVSYVGANPGRDTVRAIRVINGTEQTFPAAEVNHTWVLPPPAVALTQDPATSRIGTSLTLTVTLTGGRCCGTTTVKVAGANSQSLTLSSEGSPFTARYTGRNAGTDTITATWADQLGSVTDRVTHTWTRPEIGVSLDAAAADLGATAVVTVRVPETVGGRVRVAVTGGPNAGRDLDLTGAAPEFRARYVGLRPGSDTIQASLVGDGDALLASATATRTWNTPAVALVGSSPPSLVGEVYTVTATVTGTVTSDVAFKVEGTNAGATVERAGQHPTFTARYPGTRPGSDRVTASISVGGVGYAAAPLGHEWVQPTVAVTQETEASKIGEPVLLTATVTPRTAGAVMFTVQGAGAPLVLRGSGAGFTATYTRQSAGTDTVSATLTGPGGGTLRSTPIQHVWTVDSPPTVVVSPAGTTSCTGGRFAATVSVRDDGGRPAGVAVQLTATISGAPDQTLTGTTDRDGRVALSFTRDVPGVDSLVATARLGGKTVRSARTTHVWEACELAATVGPAGTTSLVGATFTPTVSVLDKAGAPVAAAAVELTVSMTDQPDVTATLTTDVNGLVSFPYPRLVEGTDRIAVVATAGGRRGEAATDHFWSAEPGLQVSLAPAGTTSVVGGTFTVTALVSDAGRPVVDASVIIRAAMPDQPDLEQTVQTDADGLASFAYTRPVAGTDTLLADVTADDRNGRASVVHVWRLVPRLELTIEPAGTASLVGTELTATLTVVDAGTPASGVDVAFRATRPDQPDVTQAARTDADGRARFPYTRTEVGLDTVTATAAAADGRRGEASMAHLWRTEELVAVPPKPTSLEVRGGGGVPGGQATAVGTGCSAGSDVDLRVGDRSVATTRATPGGTFEVGLRIPPLQVGRHELVALCTPVRLKANMDVVVPTSSNGTAAAAATTAVAMFTFFVLLGGQLVRLSGGYPTGGS